ncbi:MAG: ABC transporter permease [Saprospiraceae bacterium]|nr:ABC transporter permease [Saprospiraceae bacterium]
MFDYDKWQEIFGTIRKHKTRTFLTALGVFWGIFMLVFLMGSGKGLENGVMTNFGSRATNALYVWTQNTSLPYAGLQSGRRVRLTEADIQAIKSNFAHQIEYMAPRIFVMSGEIARDNKSGSFDVRGESPDFINIEAFKIIDGRFINPLDMLERRKVIVIGKYVRDLLFAKEEKVIGQYLRISGIEYKVVGICQSSRGGQDQADDEKTIMMPMTTAQQVTNNMGRIGWFICTARQDVKVSALEGPLKALLRTRHKIHPDDDQGIRSFNLEKEFAEVQGLFFGIRFIIWIVGIGSLLAGIIGVGNIMLIIVKERTKEIGIRKSMGATPGSIVSMILLESVFITTLAGYFGLLLSTGIIAALNQAVGVGGEFFANPEIDFKVGIAALFILIIAGALTGLVPALQAANVNPVIALKDE